MQTAYSKHSPVPMNLQGGILVPVNIEPVEVSTEDSATETHYKFNLLKFQEIPTSEMIEQYQSVGADVQALSEKHPDWLKRLPNRAIDKLDLAKLFNGAVLAQNLTDDERAAILGAYDEWQPAKEYEKDKLLSRSGKLYKVNQTHTSQEAYPPDSEGVTALYSEVAPAGVIPLWKQPEGQHDSYVLGDLVQWPEGTVWECTGGDAEGYNVWEPGVYGWTQVEP